MSKYPLIATKIPPQVADHMMFILYVAKLAQWPLRASLSGSTAPQPPADPRPLAGPAHNTASQVEGSLGLSQKPTRTMSRAVMI